MTRISINEFTKVAIISALKYPKLLFEVGDFLAKIDAIKEITTATTSPKLCRASVIRAIELEIYP
jgi:hypothetical protein